MRIKTACLLLSVFHAGSAAALGLGEISVRSYLGQPLHATVLLLGAAPETTADCFSVGASTGSIAPPRRAQLRIEQTGAQMRLHIRTAEAVNDPIMQFELASDCESRLRRDYVVLLDPPAREEPAVAPEVPAAESAAATASTAPVPLISPRPRRATPAVAADFHADAARQSTRLRPAKPKAQPAQPTATPRLVLSGKRTAYPDSPPALRLDTNLPDMNRRLPDGLTAAELSDEYTALTRKLAHLEAQLVDLQQKNTRLETRNAAIAASMPQKPAEKPAQWPLYLLVTGLAAGGIALIAWLRSRSRHHPADSNLADIWASPAEPTKPVSDKMDADPWAQPASMEADTPPAAQRMPEIAPPSDQSTEVKDDILDQAEVYMAHGHGEIAIHLLQEHLRNAPDESPVPWLLLLDLLHRDGDMPGYTAASTECRRYFNVNLTSHPISQDNDTGNGLEAYPHVLEQLEKVWGTPNTERFFRDLLYDDRGGTRLGFEPAAYRDILLLQAIAQNVKPLAV